jgi:hypothetical protein
MRYFHFAASLLGLCLLSSCRDDKAHEEIDSLRSLVLSMSDKIADTQPAYLSSSSKGYQYVTTAAGRFLIKLDQIEPHLDGHKVSVQIGNPYLTTFTGFTLLVDFGVRPPTYPSSDSGSQDPTAQLNVLNYEVAFAAWKKTLMHSTISFTEVLTPGRWTKMQFFLSPSKPEDLGYIAVNLKLDKASLSEQQ